MSATRRIDTESVTAACRQARPARGHRAGCVPARRPALPALGPVPVDRPAVDATSGSLRTEPALDPAGLTMASGVVRTAGGPSGTGTKEGLRATALLRHIDCQMASRPSLRGTPPGSPRGRPRPRGTRQAPDIHDRGRVASPRCRQAAPGMASGGWSRGQRVVSEPGGRQSCGCSPSLNAGVGFGRFPPPRRASDGLVRGTQAGTPARIVQETCVPGGHEPPELVIWPRPVPRR